MKKSLDHLSNKEIGVDSDFKFANEGNFTDPEFTQHYKEIQTAEIELKTSENLDRIIDLVGKIIDSQIELKKSFPTFLKELVNAIIIYLKSEENKDLDTVLFKLLKNIDLEYADLQSLDKKTKKRIVEAFLVFKKDLISSPLPIEKISELVSEVEAICNKVLKKNSQELESIEQGKLRLQRLQSEDSILAKIRKYLSNK